MFTGQWFDEEIDQYYLRARYYDPYIGRFSTRDPVCGDLKMPMTLHVYLYALNNPINRIDPAGLFSMIGVLHRAARVVNAAHARNMGFAQVLSSNLSLMDMSLGMASVSNMVASYVDEDEPEDVDYRSGPEAFSSLGVTRKECSFWGKDTAEYYCKLRMAVNGGLASGMYYAGGFVSGGIGVTMNKTGYDLIKAGQLLPGMIVSGIGLGFDAWGAWSVYQAVKITLNAVNAAKMYCTCPEY